MAEFVEVMRKIERMCRESGCVECPFSSCKNCKEVYCNGFMKEYPEEAEKLVEQWNSEHPEPLYPTWEQWQKKMFTENEENVSPCQFVACRKHGSRVCDPFECIKHRIPADIAEKLGINPGEEWAYEIHD